MGKILETCLVNMSRLHLIWNMVSKHLLDVCGEKHVLRRQWGALALTRLLKAAIDADHSVPLSQNQVFNKMHIAHVYCTLYSVQCTAECMAYTLYIVYCAPHNVRCNILCQQKRCNKTFLAVISEHYWSGMFCSGTLL